MFDELVALFIAAKTKRQVIMVTHNANLVINTDADQIIVAKQARIRPAVFHLSAIRRAGWKTRQFGRPSATSWRVVSLHSASAHDGFASVSIDEVEHDDDA